MTNTVKSIIGVFLAFGLLAVSLVFMRAEPVAPSSQQEESAAAAIQKAHESHLPPTYGSGIYQYDPPGRRRFDAGSVFDPFPPPRRSRPRTACGSTPW